MHNRYVVAVGIKNPVRRMLAICLAFCLSILPALSKDKADVVPPGNWGAVQSLAAGTEISLRLKSGDRIDGRIQGLNPDSIRLIADEKERNYPRADVVEVRQVRVKDRKLDGALIGMGAGAAAGIIAAYAVDTGGGNRWSQEDAPGPIFLLAGLGLGALVGVVVDASIKGDRLLYRK